MDILIEQEMALHQYEIRKNKDAVIRLLHPNFKEVGKSGASYEYEEIVQSMSSEKLPSVNIHSQNYECIQLAPSVSLLLYQSVCIDKNGKKSHFTKRSSIWVFNGENWQIKYHQGTPCSEFVVDI